MCKCYMDTESWKQEDCIEILKKKMGGIGEEVEQVISLAIRRGILQDELPKKYSFADLDRIKLLLNAKIPISDRDRERTRHKLIKFDELELVKDFADLPSLVE